MIEKPNKIEKSKTVQLKKREKGHKETLLEMKKLSRNSNY